MGLCTLAARTTPQSPQRWDHQQALLNALLSFKVLSLLAHTTKNAGITGMRGQLAMPSCRLTADDERAGGCQLAPKNPAFSPEY
jgi:hypothetical protein